MAPEMEPRKTKTQNNVERRKLNTKGCCFLCLTVIEVKTEEVALVDKSDEKAPATNDYSVSLKLLNYYLNINLEKLFENLSSVSRKDGDGSSSAVTKEQGKEIQVDLCQPCGGILDKVSKLFLSLEKIQMEMDFWQGRIHQQISNASKILELVHNYSKRMTSDPETLLQLAFVDRYRKEISKMSLQESKRRSDANVKLVRLKNSHVNSAKIKTSTSATPHHQTSAPAATDTEEPQIDHLLKFEHQEEYHDDGPLEQTPPNSPPLSLLKINTDLVTEKKKCKGVDRPQTVKTKSETKIIFFQKTGKYCCTKCKKEFTQPGHARIHYDAIHLQRKWKCDICNLSVFSDPSNLLAHKKTCRDALQKRLSVSKAKQNDPRYKFACPTCGKKFKTHSHMLRHNRIVHLKERNHACDICNKTFSTAGDLKRHKNAVHLGITFKCETCHKEFKYRINHQRHERICDKKSVIPKIKK